MQCAIVYDFDGTLAEGDCAQHGLMPALGINDVGAFWQAVKDRARQNDGDEILAYLGLLADYARKNAPEELSESRLRQHGAAIPLFAGVGTWFERINRYASDDGIALSHYVISSGLEAMIQGTKIAPHFRRVFACKFQYNPDTGQAEWPSLTINYTTKTQFLFRINKGINNNWDNDAVNRFIEPHERLVPFSRMIYLGDGDTDIPSMKMVRYQGGVSLAVFDNQRWAEEKTQKKIEKLIAEERANYVVPALYDPGSQLDVTIKGLLQLFKRRERCT
jgi:hypothetical protein